MNGNFYQNPTFPTTFDQSESKETELIEANDYMQIPCDIKQIIKLNKGKKITVFCSFNNSNEWRDKIFTGIIEGIGIDYFALSKPDTGEWLLIPINYLCYFEFEEKITQSI